MIEKFRMDPKLLAILLILLSSCMANSPIEKEELIIPSITPNLASTSVNTTPEISVSTAMLSPTATPLSVPAELQGNQDEILASFFAINNSDDCNLPCWWNIKPSVTTIESASGLLENFGISPSKTTHVPQELEMFVTRIFDLSIVSYFAIDLVVEDGTVVNIVIGGAHTKNPSNEFKEMLGKIKLRSMVTDFGPPQEAFLGIDLVDADPGGGEYYFDLWLNYEKQGVHIHVLGTHEYPDIAEEFVSICLNEQSIFGLHLYLQSPEYKRPIVNMTNYRFGDDSGILELIERSILANWDLATDLPLEALTQLITSDGEDNCFETSRTHWH